MEVTSNEVDVVLQHVRMLAAEQVSRDCHCECGPEPHVSLLDFLKGIDRRVAKRDLSKIAPCCNATERIGEWEHDQVIRMGFHRQQYTGSAQMAEKGGTSAPFVGS